MKFFSGSVLDERWAHRTTSGGKRDHVSFFPSGLLSSDYVDEPRRAQTSPDKHRQVI